LSRCRKGEQSAGDFFQAVSLRCSARNAVESVLLDGTVHAVLRLAV